MQPPHVGTTLSGQKGGTSPSRCPTPELPSTGMRSRRGLAPRISRRRSQPGGFDEQCNCAIYTATWYLSVFRLCKLHRTRDGVVAGEDVMEMESGGTQFFFSFSDEPRKRNPIVWSVQDAQAVLRNEERLNGRLVGHWFRRPLIAVFLAHDRRYDRSPESADGIGTVLSRSIACRHCVHGRWTRRATGVEWRTVPKLECQLLQNLGAE